MATKEFDARIDSEGRLVVPVSDIPAGTRVRINAILIDEESGKEVLLESRGSELRSVVIEYSDPACKEIRDVAMGTMAFWDNPVDNEIWG